MIAEGVRDTDLGAYQRAARALLVHPLITATHPDGDALRLVRRFAPALVRDLDAVAGYRLELTATCARLVKRIDRLDPTQVTIQPRNRKRFDRRRYAYLCLVLGALGRAGSQVALSEMADGLRRRAAEIERLGFDPDEYRHRLAFVDVLVHLESLRVLAAIETSSVTYLQDPDAGEALYDVDRDAVHQLFVPPRVVQHVGTAAALLADELSASRDTRRAASRQRLGRLLLELPVVYLDDHSPADRAYLQSQARSLMDDLGLLTGAQLERRAEGVALIDSTGGFSDRRFPTGGTPAQVALLLASAIANLVGPADAPGHVEPVTVPRATAAVGDLVERLDRARPARTRAGDDLARGAPERWPTDPPTLGPPGGDLEEAAPATGPFLPDAWLASSVDRLVESHGKAFAGVLRDDPASLLRAGVEVLVAFDLIRLVPGGAVARPAIARFRDLSVTTIPAAQLSLLDVGSPS